MGWVHRRWCWNSRTAANGTAVGVSHRDFSVLMVQVSTFVPARRDGKPLPQEDLQFNRYPGPLRPFCHPQISRHLLRLWASARLHDGVTNLLRRRIKFNFEMPERLVVPCRCFLWHSLFSPFQSRRCWSRWSILTARWRPSERTARMQPAWSAPGCQPRERVAWTNLLRRWAARVAFLGRHLGGA
jgi:hypothetical protein